MRIELEGEMGSFVAWDGMLQEEAIAEFAKLARRLQNVRGLRAVSAVYQAGHQYATLVTDGRDWALLGKEIPIAYSGQKPPWKILCSGVLKD